MCLAYRLRAAGRSDPRRAVRLCPQRIRRHRRLRRRCGAISSRNGPGSPRSRSRRRARSASSFRPRIGIGLTIVALGTIAILTMVNLAGARSAGWVQLAATLIKIIPLFAVVIARRRALRDRPAGRTTGPGPDHRRRHRRRRGADAVFADRLRMPRPSSPRSPTTRATPSRARRSAAPALPACSTSPRPSPR